ncbi:hypothetical protein GP486_007354 [Trichoglossum hirsutum]|uniref:DUF6594 domain-containing protein n=1 Tax=Trichoglossum hirsutum TaxID=265104 RepID=A0A9P8ICW7_9PEZI|nr:hypothetical protein GP486_007354 [Trichoglossum hirsutum]
MSANGSTTATAAPTVERQGYHKLAAIMGPHSEMAIFRRFSALGMLDLLSLQAELMELEVKFRDICKEDDMSAVGDDKLHSLYFHALRKSEGGDNDEQYQMLVQIRVKLRAYNEALIQAAQLSKLGRPSEANLQLLRDWLIDSKGGDCFLMGSEAFTWDDTSDLISLFNQEDEQDPFSRWLSATVLGWYHTVFGHRRKNRKFIDVESGIVEYRDASLARISTIAATTLSSILPILAVLVLYFVKSTLKRIGVMIGFTTVFAAALATFTSARRVEIFAATATFAAVEVVFIGSVTV